MQISGQHEISTSDTSEKAIDVENIAGSIVRVRNVGSSIIYIGDKNVDDESGFGLKSGNEEAVRLVGIKRTGYRDLFVYGTSGDSLEWVVIA